MSAPLPRTARTGYDLRFLRAAVFAAVCVVLAATGHGLASCAAVPVWTLGAGFLAVFAVAAGLAGRERTLPGIVAFLAVGQTLLHTLFELGQRWGAVPMSGHATPTADATLVERAARIMCGTSAAALSPARAQKILADARLNTGVDASAVHHPADALATMAGPGSMLPSVPMLLGHVLAAVAAGWVLRRGDIALLGLLRLSAQELAEGALVRSLRAAFTLVRVLLSGLPGAPGTGPRAPRTAFLVPPKPPASALQHSVIRRGPPSPTPYVLAA
ncbi:hypothetical protein ACFSL4_24715 [Streptomyces caeni]|uniref:Integral membrane protein n=1 Tax=Streptomyces caeni TaxID=2307231 RepID=A0ABW4IVA3_9ACTN